MKKVYLPGFMKYKACSDLVRLGSKNDGGYLVSRRDIEKSSILLSFGINADWRFEKDFFSKKDGIAYIWAYDASTSMSMFFSQAYKYLCRIDPFGVAKWLYRALDYKLFFKGRVKHYPVFVGGVNKGFVKFSEVMDKVREGEEVFVKMDIEGWEYRCLDEIVKHKDKICGVAIEFHDVDLHLEKIEHFVREIGIPIAHIHPTNCAPVNEDGMPMVIEVTFSRYGAIDEDMEPEFPHPLDAPVCHKKEDYVIEFLSEGNGV